MLARSLGLIDHMKKNITIVEDDPGIREVINILLSPIAHLRIFSNAQEFYQYPEKERQNLFILDVMLPDGNGVEICSYLKERIETSKIPVFLMSANSRNSLLTNACADDFIQKPFDIHSFMKKVKESLVDTV